MIYCDLMALENYFQQKNIFHFLAGLAISIAWSLSGKHADLTHLVSDTKTVLLMRWKM